MMESIDGTYDDASDTAGEVNNVQTGGMFGDLIEPDGADAHSRHLEGPEAADEDRADAAAPIFEAVERELNGGQQLP